MYVFYNEMHVVYIYGLISSLFNSETAKELNKSPFLYFYFYFCNAYNTVTVFKNGTLFYQTFLFCFVGFTSNSDVLFLYRDRPCLSK